MTNYESEEHETVDLFSAAIDRLATLQLHFPSPVSNLPSSPSSPINTHVMINQYSSHATLTFFSFLSKSDSNNHYIRY